MALGRQSRGQPAGHAGQGEPGTAIDGQTDKPPHAGGLPPWLLHHRVALPDRSPGYLRRAALAERCAPTAHRLTLLVAPGGFGKTTLLVESCHDARESGVPVAWLTLAEDDAETLGVHLAHAFQEAGLDVLGSLRSDGPPHDAAYTHIGLLGSALAGHDGPFVLALDEAERLADPSASAVLSEFLRLAPGNLHVAIAGRELPSGVDLAAPGLAADIAVVSAADLRFTRDDMALFFDRTLSPAELESVASASQGWPIALRIRRNDTGGTERSRVLSDLVGNWVGSRLWHSFSGEDGAFVLDLGLFDWFDPALLDAVLGAQGGAQRLESIRALDGLLGPVGEDGSGVRALHPLIRDHCARRLRRDSPARFRSVHGRIAQALHARGRPVEAMRHAAEAEDPRLPERILVEAGGVRLCLHQGFDQLVAATRLLGDGDGNDPRLLAARGAALAACGRLHDARRVLATMPPLSAGAPAESPPEAADVYLDRWLARAIVAHFGAESAPTAETRHQLANGPALAALPSTDSVVGIGVDFLLCVHAGIRADFDAAADHARRLRGLRAVHAPFLVPAVEIELGLAAMAQGRVDDATERYRNAQRLAQGSLVHAPRLMQASDVLARELRLERNHARADRAGPRDGIRTGSSLATYLAACDLAVEQTLAAEGVDAAVAAATAMAVEARQTGLPSVVRHLGAQRVSLLADADRAGQAERAWRAAALPDTDDGCLDLDAQSWRELESVSCARLRLLTVQRRFRDGRCFSRAVLRVAASHRLRRTEMRVLVLRMKLEDRAGSRDGALAELGAFLDLLAETDYARPLLREGDLATAMLRQCAAADPGRGDAAERLLASADALDAAVHYGLTGREVEVLDLLDYRDDHIADALGISRHGVRYHVGKILRKLGVRNRREAVARARSLGIPHHARGADSPAPPSRGPGVPSPQDG